MNKIFKLIFASLLLLAGSSEALVMHLLGPTSSPITDVSVPLELNEHGVVIGHRVHKTAQGAYQDPVYADKRDGGIAFYVTRYTHYDTDFFPTYWNFSSGQFAHIPGGRKKFTMNNQNILIVENDQGDEVASITHPDGSVTELSRIRIKDTLALFPDGTSKKLSLLSQDDVVLFFDDEGNVTFKHEENGVVNYYSQNVNEGENQVVSEGIEELSAFYQKRFKGRGEISLPSNAELSQEITTHFYGAPAENKGKLQPGWKILEVILANNNGQFVAKASYTKKHSNEEITFENQRLYGGNCYIFVDLNQ